MNLRIIACAMAALGAAAMFSGCTTHARETQLDRGPKTAALEPQDVRRSVEKMVDSMLADQAVITEIGGKRPVLDIIALKNKTTMHLDTKSITDSIRTKLIRSRKFRFMDATTAASDLKTMNDQALNGMTDQSKAIRVGQQSAVQMLLYGELSEMRDETDGITDRYFKLNLNLKDVRTGEIVWSDEQEIRKEMKKSMMGF